MLDINIIRQNHDLIKENIKKRNLKLNLDEFLEIDRQKLQFIVDVDELRAIKNKVSKEMPILSGKEKSLKIIKMKELSKKLFLLEKKQKVIEKKWNNLYYKIPNLLDKEVVIWATSKDNLKIGWFLEPTKFDFEPKCHSVIWEEKWWIDIEKWSKVSWARFWYLKWDLVLLQFALINYAIAKLVLKWFKPILPPILVRERAMFWTWFFPSWEDWLYRVNQDEDDLHLIWTSEVPVMSYHQDEILDLEKPKMYVAYSSCFRREAWSAWKDMKWILRWHQFDKIEMVCFCKPEKSKELQNFMIGIEEEIWQWLKIPYNKINICSWDLWNSAIKKIDLEAWMPWQNKYIEVTSCSNVWEYQSRRLNIKYKDLDWKSQYAHSLNWTVIALWRCLMAIMENYQTKDWNIKIPDVLIPFMGGKKDI